MVKCKVCEAVVPILFDGRCTACMSVESMELSQAEMDFICGIMGTPLKDGELMKIFREDAIYTGGVSDKNTPKDKKSERLVSVVIDSIKKRSSDAYLFETPLTLMINKHRDKIESGEYSIDLMKNYGITGGGQVVETKAGVVIYKKAEFYDDDEVDDSIDPDEEE